jgi:hypothetical protein
MRFSYIVIEPLFISVSADTLCRANSYLERKTDPDILGL